LNIQTGVFLLPELKGDFVMTLGETLKQIRLKCLDCCCQQTEEVVKCTVTRCPLYELRLGKNPSPSRKGGKGNPEALKKFREAKASESKI
jgi:hypothetical protein